MDRRTFGGLLGGLACLTLTPYSTIGREDTEVVDFDHLHGTLFISDNTSPESKEWLLNDFTKIMSEKVTGMVETKSLPIIYSPNIRVSLLPNGLRRIEQYDAVRRGTVYIFDILGRE